uniref:Uncharacterized protein n=1 Tax=Anguilla anguilla TaxID=7936 RepID=A0A0E9W606_ANGAN
MEDPSGHCDPTPRLCAYNPESGVFTDTESSHYICRATV